MREKAEHAPHNPRRIAPSRASALLWAIFHSKAVVSDLRQPSNRDVLGVPDSYATPPQRTLRDSFECAMEWAGLSSHYCFQRHDRIRGYKHF